MKSNSRKSDPAKGATYGDQWWVAPIMAMRRQIERVKRECRIRNDINALLEFEDHELTDIGIGRGEILHVVRYGRLPRRRSVRPLTIPKAGKS